MQNRKKEDKTLFWFCSFEKYYYSSTTQDDITPNSTPHSIAQRKTIVFH